MGALARIRARLAPGEAAIADLAFALMVPVMQAEWLAAMSVLGVDQAADIVRFIIPDAPAETAAAANSSRGDGGSCS